MYAALKNRLHHWLFRPREPEAGTIVLRQRRVFIVPTRQGFVYAATLLVMLIGSINYGLSLGFVLTFLLAGLGVNAMLHTFRNLAHLRISAGRAAPVFAGEHARFAVHVRNPTATDRFGIGLARLPLEAEFFGISAQHDMLVGVSVPAPRRGVLRPGRLTLFTRYPLGLFYAWSHLDLDARCVIYPRPLPPGVPLPREPSAAGSGTLHGEDQEDFAGLRHYHSGDSLRRIAWKKAAARGGDLLTKHFSGRAAAELWLDWHQLPATMNLEQKLSQLARWVLDARASESAFGLRLPGATIPMASGDAQRERCLEALALFELHPTDGNGHPAQPA